MSLTFPREMTSAYDWPQADLVLVYRQELARTAGGTPQAKDMGPAVWRATYASVPMVAAAAWELYADFLTLRGAAQPFYLTPIPDEPAARNGEALSGVTVGAVATNNDALALSGLPAGFVLTAGDFLSIATSAGTELHQLARGGTADGVGDTGEIEVVPHVRPAVSVGDAVALVGPVVEMQLEPGSLRHERLNAALGRVSFQATQVIR